VIAAATRTRVCHVTTAGGAAAAGVFTSIHGIVGHLGRRGRIDVQLLSAARAAAPHAGEWAIPGVDHASWAYRGPTFFCYGPALQSLLPSAADTVVHQHGLWQYMSIACADLQRLRGCRRVVSPHGMLHPWALRVRPYRKRAAWAAYERRSSTEADVFHATAAAEADYVRDRGLRQPIAVIPHGVDVPEAPPEPTIRDTGPTALFLSRLHPGKRVEDLLAAWAWVRPRGWRLVIAGPDDGGHRATLEPLARDMADSVRFVGPAHGAEKERLFREADLFVLPSLSENFGLVVAESLARGVPVITTTGTPWSQLPARGCGWWIRPAAEPLAEALREAVAIGPEGLAAMGRRGWEYARSELTWDRVATQYEELYGWLAGGGDMPSFVET
jgi:glycosyltransferase involved in cell wall biosynthesis